MEYRTNFPKSLAELKAFVAERLFNVESIDDPVCASIVEKVRRGERAFSDNEIRVMRKISNIGDVCHCDTDHRKGPDGKTCAFASR